MRLLAIAAALLLSSCDQGNEPGSAVAPTGANVPALPANLGRGPSAAPAATARASAPPPIERELILAEWREADNRGDCAPIAFTDVGGAAADARPALFAGGWAVAFDQQERRSLYGVAGTGVRVDDVPAEAAKLGAQWPYSRELADEVGGLPAGAMAGYGREGAEPYAPSNPDGIDRKSLAYVVIPGQHCLYNVWSQLGRRHLETLLDSITMIPVR